MNDTYDRAELLKQLKIDEGVINRPYDDRTGKRIYAPVGKITIGIGWNLDANPLPLSIIEYMCYFMMDRCEEIWDSVEPRWRQLDPPRQRVLMNMAYQLGPVRLLGFKNTIKFLRQHLDGFPNMYPVIADEMMDSEAARNHPERWGRHERTMRGE